MLRALGRRRSVILGYHGIADCDSRHDIWRLQVSPAHFRRHVELLLAAGFHFMTLAEAADELSQHRPRPGVAVVTFDDGMRNNLSVAEPILTELDVPATVYVACDFIGGYSPWVGPEGGGEMLDETEIRALKGAGWEIGAHSLSHADMAVMDYDQCRHEIDGSRARLEQITGATVDTFAYPFGRYGAAAVSAVADSGMRAAVTIGSGSWDRFELTRAMCSRGEPYGVVALKMLDLYEPLLRLPPVARARSVSKGIRRRIVV